MYREAIRVFRQIGDLEGVTTASANLGDISLARRESDRCGTRSVGRDSGVQRKWETKTPSRLTLADLAEIGDWTVVM